MFINASLQVCTSCLQTKAKLQACIKNVNTWMTCNHLLLNGAGPKHLRDTLADDVASLDDAPPAPRFGLWELSLIRTRPRIREYISQI